MTYPNDPNRARDGLFFGWMTLTGIVAFITAMITSALASIQCGGFK